LEFDQDSDTFTFDEIFVQKNFLAYADVINNVCEDAREEYKIESSLTKIKTTWEGLKLVMEDYKNTKKIVGTDAFFTTLE